MLERVAGGTSAIAGPARRPVAPRSDRAGPVATAASIYTVWTPAGFECRGDCRTQPLRLGPWQQPFELKRHDAHEPTLISWRQVPTGKVSGRAESLVDVGQLAKQGRVDFRICVAAVVAHVPQRYHTDAVLLSANFATSEDRPAADPSLPRCARPARRGSAGCGPVGRRSRTRRRCQRRLGSRRCRGRRGSGR